MLDLATGALERTAQFTDPDGAMSGRAYGWMGVFNLDDDPRLEVVILGDFLPHIQVLGWNNNNQLIELWDRIFEQTTFLNEKIHKVTANAVADVDQDGRLDIVTSVFNENNDNAWHVLVLDAKSGMTKLDLVNHYAAGVWDLDGNGVAELMLNTTIGQLVNESGPAIIGTFSGGSYAELWRAQNARFQWSILPRFPDHVNSRTTLYKNHPSLWPGWGGHAVLFVTREPAANEAITLRFWSYDGTQISEQAWASGPNLTVLGSTSAALNGSGLIRSTYTAQTTQTDVVLNNASAVDGLRRARATQ